MRIYKVSVTLCGEKSETTLTEIYSSMSDKSSVSDAIRFGKNRLINLSNYNTLGVIKIIKFAVPTISRDGLLLYHYKGHRTIYEWKEGRLIYYSGFHEYGIPKVTNLFAKSELQPCPITGTISDD